MEPDQDVLRAKILIVDDDPFIIRLLSTYLKTEGFSRIRSVTDPRKAVDEYQSFAPDLVILDIFMPHIDGFALMEKIKSLTPESDNILIFTFFDKQSTREKAFSMGAIDILGKPFERREAVDKIRAALRRCMKKGPETNKGENDRGERP